MHGKTMIKMAAALLLALGITGILSACGQEQQTVTNEKGEQLVYKAYEIKENGFYVHDKKEDTFVPVMGGFSGYSGPPASNSRIAIGASGNLDRYIWISNRDFEPDDLIPIVDNKRTELVLWQKGEEDMPEEYTIEKYARLGWTIGAHFSFGDTGKTLYLDNNDRCKNSDADSKLKSYSDELLRVGSINNHREGDDTFELAKSNVDTKVNILLGLSKGKKYRLGLFDGTQHSDFDVLADTLAFKSTKYTRLNSPYSVTENNYFIINLPKNLIQGYYFINSAGMFRYTGHEADVVDPAEVPVVEEPEPAETKKEKKNDKKKDKDKVKDKDKKKDKTKKEKTNGDQKAESSADDE